MSARSMFFLGLIGVFTVLSAATGADNVSLPFVSPMFGDNMVLQRGKPNPIWGWAKPGEEVQVKITGDAVKTVAKADGRWQVEIQPPAPGGPYTITVDGPQHVGLRDVLVGDVWLCGGQSNMEMGLGQVRNVDEEIKSANHPRLRLYTVGKRVSYSPASVPQGSWKICSPQTVGDGGWGGFSAVAYFFGRRLQQETNVPIGLIQDCLGGTPVESWMSSEALRGVGDFDAPLDEIDRLRAKGGPQHGSFLMHWLDEYDVGSKSNTWAALYLNDPGWKTVLLPSAFRELGVADVPAVCWFRKTFKLPENVLPRGGATIYLGAIEKMDTTYINGRWIGASSWAENPRVYQVPEGVLLPGRNEIAIRVFKLKSPEAFLSKPEVMRLEPAGKTVIPLATELRLAEEWEGKLSVDARPPHPLPLSYENYPTMPAVLHQGMIAPVAPLALTGAIWYQGEANAERAYQYRKLLPAMIADWRKSFGQGDFPFYIVSLPAFMRHQNHPVESSWAELREAQALTAKNVRNCGLAVAIDTGDADDIHPKDKREIGERLALCALAQRYGKKIPFRGPTFKSVETLPGALKLHFDHADGGLVVKGDKLEEFAIAGEDRKWFWADARIEGDAVVVSSPKVPAPKAARYAWQSNPNATLFNTAGLPAGPFRTDNWPGVTDKRE